jgi:hypothetical protein
MHGEGPPAEVRHPHALDAPSPRSRLQVDGVGVEVHLDVGGRLEFGAVGGAEAGRCAVLEHLLLDPFGVEVDERPAHRRGPGGG